MYPVMRVRESVGRRCDACDETPKIRNPNKHTRFDKFKIGGLSIKLFIGVSPLYISEGCPKKIIYRSMSTIYFEELSIKLFIGVSPLYVSEGCPQNYLLEYVHYLCRRVVYK